MHFKMSAICFNLDWSKILLSGNGLNVVDNCVCFLQPVKSETTPPVKEKDEKSMTKQEKDLQAEEVVKEVLKAIQRAKEEAQREEKEAKLGSSVTVRYIFYCY